MVRINRILKDYREAGSVNSLLALWGFIDDHTFLTKAGHLGVAFRVRGVDYECLDHPERQAIAHRFEQALRQLDESFRLYEYVVKRHAPIAAPIAHPNPIVDEALRRRAEYLASKAESLFELELFFVVMLESSAGQTSGSRWAEFIRGPFSAVSGQMSASTAARVLADGLERSRVRLHQKAHAFAVQLGDTIAPELLTKHETFSFLRQLVNYRPYKRDGVVLKYDTHLDFYLSDSAVECHRDHLDVDGYRVKVLTMKEPPAKTFAAVLQELYTVPSPFIACLEWQRVANTTMRRDLQSRRRHFFNKKVSMVNYLSSQTKPEEMLVDDSATATVNELGRGLTAMEVEGHFFGSCSLTIVVYDEEAARLERAVAECAKAFAAHDGAIYDETYNLLNAWLATVPGNAAHNLRRLALLNTNCADLSFLFTLHSGSRTSAHLGGAECLAVFETEYQTPYFWNLHHEDVGHALIQGATGSGKSFLLNFILTHAQKYNPLTVIFDLGGSYEKLTELLGGSTWRMGLSHRDFTINPFCLPPTQENLHFLFSFVRVLLQSSGQYAMTMQDDRDVYEAVENLYALEPAQRRLITLTNILPRPLAQHLHRWVQGGPYAALFDNVEDTLTLQRVQCFDFEGLDKFPLVLEPLLFYVLHRASASIHDRARDAELKLFALDEAWRFARDTTVKAYITEALKTWRKRNAAMILATQSSQDFAATDLLRTVVESCPTKWFLANPGMDLERARELFHLNETEASLIARLIPRQQALLKRPDVAKVLNLHVDPYSYWIYTNTPVDNARLAALRQADGLKSVVDRLATTA
jgi:type IV secretion system protein TrbE